MNVYFVQLSIYTYKIATLIKRKRPKLSHIQKNYYLKKSTILLTNNSYKYLTLWQLMTSIFYCKYIFILNVYKIRKSNNVN